MRRLLVSLMLMTGPLWAGTVTLTAENDAIYQTDLNYTHGTRLAYQNDGAVTDDQSVSYRGWAVAQNLYAPADIEQTNHVAGDRRYCAWLVGGPTWLNWQGWRSRYRELDVGVVGPWALGREAQTTVHRWVGDHLPQGWDDQCRNAPVISFTDRWALDYMPVSRIALVPHAGYVIGDLMTYANAGGEIRIGSNPVVGARPNLITPAWGDTGLLGGYVFAGLDGRAVAYNVALDGNLFCHNGMVNRKPFVYDRYTGLAIQLWRIEARLTLIVRSREFDTQARDERFGSGSLTVRF